MRISTYVLRTVAVCATLLSLSAAVATASPITVNLRVEGSSKTLFEGPIAVEAIPNPPGLSTKSSSGAHPCDVSHNGSNGGFVPAGASPTAALAAAAQSTRLPFDAGWSSEFNDFFVSQFGPDVNGGAPEFPSWGYAVNYTTANVGGCQFQLAAGSEVLWAYNYFNLPHLLALTGPAGASAGVPFKVHVADGQTGAPVAGAAVGQDIAGVTSTLPGSGVTDSAGNVTLTLASAGTPALKASAQESVRSNALLVCVHNGEDGTCGTTKPVSSPIVKTQPPAITPAAVQVSGILAGHLYGKHGGPRLLAGIVHPGTETIKAVRISLQRRIGKRCVTFSGARGRFVRSACGHASFFSVGNALSFSYLLPSRLSTGRYTFDVEAITTTGATRTARVSFRVR